jgi:twinkle protein
MQSLDPSSIDLAAYLSATHIDHKLRPIGYWADDILDTLDGTLPVRGEHLPWPAAQGKVLLRPHELSMWVSSNGSGKSLITGQVALSLAAQGARVAIASMEMHPRETIVRMAKQVGGSACIAPDTLRALSAWSEEKMWLYNHKGVMRWQNMTAVVRWAAAERGITHFVIDSLMKCVAGEDDYNAQKDFVNELTVACNDYPLHIHLVHHTRKTENEDTLPDKNHTKGSGAITDLAHNVFMLWRNRGKERKTLMHGKPNPLDPDAMLFCKKQRNGDWEGSVPLWLNSAGKVFMDTATRGPASMMAYPHWGGVRDQGSDGKDVAR